MVIYGLTILGCLVCSMYYCCDRSILQPTSNALNLNYPNAFTIRPSTEQNIKIYWTDKYIHPTIRLDHLIFPTDADFNSDNIYENY